MEGWAWERVLEAQVNGGGREETGCCGWKPMEVGLNDICTQIGEKFSYIKDKKV